MILDEALTLFKSLCVKHKADPIRMIRRTRNAMECEQRILIIKDMYEAGAKTWQIRKIIPRDESTLRHARKKVL